MKVVGEQAGIPVYSNGTQPVVKTAQEAIQQARHFGNDVMIIDTAGRLHVDNELMDELSNLKDTVQPQEILLVIDAMTGQDAVNVATAFNEKLSIDGVILTKLDSDTRGGAALSVRAVTGKPIKFAGTGEKLGDFEPFHPERMASRILGMGDVLTLIEKAAQMTEGMDSQSTQVDLSHDAQRFSRANAAAKKMGPLKNVLGMLPGIGTKIKNVEVDDDVLKKPEAIIRSMTLKNNNPSVLNEVAANALLLELA